MSNRTSAPSTHRMIMRHHPRVGVTFVPNVAARIPHEGDGYFVRTNSQGFRSNHEFVRERSDRPRILVFGDSYTAGDGCDNDERFPEILGDALGADVYNYGLSGTGTDQQLLAFEEFGQDVEADLIVLAVMVENIERVKVASRETIDRTTRERVHAAKPYFELGADGELVVRNTPVPIERPSAEESSGANVQQRLDSEHPFLTRALDVYRNDPRLAALRRVSEGWMPEIRSLGMRLTRFDPHPDYRSSESPGWRLMEAILRRFCERAHGTPIVIAPLPYSWYFIENLEPHFLPLYDRLDEPAAGVHVVDVTTPLRGLSKADRQGLRFTTDMHYSPQGHRQVASVLEREIRSRNLLPPPQAPSLASPPRPAPASAARPEGTTILGLSCFYHDSGAALIRDGEIIAAAAEERFSRVKNDRRFPRLAVNFCLEEAGIHANDLSAIVYYDNPALTFERLLHTIGTVGDAGEDSWLRSMPSWIQYKLHSARVIRDALEYRGPVFQEQHHRSHAASAFYPSPFETAAILTVDGVGEWATASIGAGNGSQIEMLREMRFPHSLGLLYSAFTQFTGFAVNSGEYKMMGLAPYGDPVYLDRIREHLVDVKEDGSIELNLDYFSFLAQQTMTNEKFAQLFDGPAREPDAWITQRERDISRSIQAVTEEAVLKMARHAHHLTGEKQLCMAGGVALNCVANGRLMREGAFERVWVQPAAGDAGGALGAALDAYHHRFGGERSRGAGARSPQRGSLLGPAFNDDEVRAFAESRALPHHPLSAEERPKRIARLLAEGRIVGHFCGRAEFGPRALGARSILGDARNSEMQSTLNLKIKYRESFRPFAPSVLASKCSDFFELEGESPYMLVVAPVCEERRIPLDYEKGADLRTIVNKPRSDLPAITHVDYSARIQTVAVRDHPEYHALIEAFEAETGYGVVVNTSFNVRGEPIVLSPYDAYRCFMRTEMDVLVLENQLFFKDEQPPWPEAKGHIEENDFGPPPKIPKRLVDRLRAIYRNSFAPAARELHQQGRLGLSLGFRSRDSCWGEAPGSAAATWFDFPDGMDSAEPTPATMAAAVTSQWSSADAAERLRPVVAELIRLGLEMPSHGEAEEVSETIYVMF